MTLSELRNITDAEWQILFSKPNWTINNILTSLGTSKSSRHWKVVRDAIDRLGAVRVEKEYLTRYSKEQIEEVIFMLLDKWKENREGVADAENTV